MGSPRRQRKGFRFPFLTRRESRRYLWALLGGAILAFFLVAVDALVWKWLPAAFYVAEGIYMLTVLPWVFGVFEQEEGRDDG
jgi:hypothetical protein